MREIKFRAWDKRHNEMIIIDDLYWFEENGVHSVDEATTTTGDYIFMQGTGLKDKNGKEIYEGDIVNWYGHKCKVEYGGLAFGIIGLEPYANGRTEYSNDTITNSKITHLEDAEVIGNIYQNPELLAA